MTPKWLETWQSNNVAPAPLQQARTTLRVLSQQGIPIPANVAGPIIEAHKAGDLEKLDPAQERRFWEAFGTLNSKIKPAENAKKYYRRTFYVVLTFLLLMQLYHTSATVVLGHLQDLSSTYQDSQAALSKPEAPPQNLKGKILEQQTYLHIAEYLMQFPELLTYVLPVRSRGIAAEAKNDREDVIAQVQLDLATSFIGKFLLPLLYGMLGAVAYVLRRLSDENESDRTIHDPRNRYSLRVPIGALSGLAAGWLLQPAAGNSMTTLSPFALAFVAGYSAELVFAAMDRIVAAFTTSSPASPGPEASAAGDLQEATTATAHADERNVEPRVPARAESPSSENDAQTSMTDGDQWSPSSRALANS